MPFCYDQPKANGDIISAANQFEQELNRHVNPWLAYIGSHMRENLVITTFLVLAGLGLIVSQAWWPEVIDPQIASAGIALSILVTIIQMLRRDAVRSDGGGVGQSEGLAFTRSQMGSVLKEMHKTLESDREHDKTGLDARSSECAMESAAKLCGLRLKALFIHQKVLRRKGLFIEESGRAFTPVIQMARLLPVVIVATGAVFAIGFGVAGGWKNLWTHAQFFLTPATPIAAAGMVTAYAPFITAVRFSRKIERQLFNVLETNWQLDPFAFDCTGPLISQYEKLLLELDHLRSTLTWHQGQNGRWNDGARPPPHPLDKDEQDDRN